MIYDLAVVGAGPAGLAAALEARRLNWHVVVIDQASEPGGKTAQYTCKADDHCRGCGACQVCDAIETVSNDPDIHLHLSTRVTGAAHSPDGYILTAPPLTMTARHLLLATGFTPFDTRLKPALGFGRYPNVTTLGHLENHLKHHAKLAPLLPNLPPSPSAAFIQCVGSRDTRRKTNYCSQVCCRVALRLANRLIHETLIADATIFYMDLQTLDGMTRRSLFESNRLRLIRALPAEVTPGPENRLVLRYEDGQTNRMIDMSTDLVVLAGAMLPAQPLDDISRLPLTTQTTGFWETTPGAPSHSLAIAGTASGPMDIHSAMIHARFTIRQLGTAGDDSDDRL